MGRHCLPLGGHVALLAGRGLVPQFQRPKPRGRPMPAPIVHSNATRARVRIAVTAAPRRPSEVAAVSQGSMFAAQKCRLGLLIRSVGLARATTKLGLANLVTNMRRLAKACEVT
jgi:IS5 family transposase